MPTSDTVRSPAPGTHVINDVCTRTLTLTGKWRAVSGLEQVKDKGIFETFSGGYLLALDTGYFTVGEPKQDGNRVL